MELENLNSEPENSAYAVLLTNLVLQGKIESETVWVKNITYSAKRDDFLQALALLSKVVKKPIKSEKIEEFKPISQEKSNEGKCKICGDVAKKHSHYGATCCYSCRQFFRRSSIKNTYKKYSCPSFGKCAEVTLENRTKCIKCRYEKCLKVGMRPEFIMNNAEKEEMMQKKRDKFKMKTLAYKERIR